MPTGTKARDLPPSTWHQASLRAGALAFAPVAVGVVPFGIIIGVLMVGVGISKTDAWLMTVALMSGAAHVATVDLMSRNAPVLVIIMTGVIINLRFVMYSATLGQYMKGVPAWSKAIFSYMLSDQAFAVSMAEFGRPDSTVHKISYFAGAALAMYATWVGSVTMGIVLGAATPASLQLDFAIPLTFMALLVPSLRDRTHVVAAMAAAVVAVSANSLPWGLGLVLAAGTGILVGYSLARRRLRMASALLAGWIITHAARAHAASQTAAQIALTSGPSFWTAVAGVALGSFALRAVFIFAMEKIPLTQTHRLLLSYIPASVLAALVSPALILHQGVITFPLDFLSGRERLIAGFVAISVALWKRSMLLTIVLGMAALYLVDYLFA